MGAQSKLYYMLLNFLWKGNEIEVEKKQKTFSIKEKLCGIAQHYDFIIWHPITFVSLELINFWAKSEQSYYHNL